MGHEQVPEQPGAMVLDHHHLFRDSFDEAWRKGYRELTPATRYNVDYSLLDTARLEPLLARIRNDMRDAGLVGGVLQGRVQPGPARDDGREPRAST